VLAAAELLGDETQTRVVLGLTGMGLAPQPQHGLRQTDAQLIRQPHGIDLRHF